MGWKIIFNYHDGGQIKISKGGKAILAKHTAERYREDYAKPSNDGGMVYHSPFKTCTPVPLAQYIKNAQ